MYMAIILGHSRRYKAKTLELLLRKLEMERVQINSLQSRRLKDELDSKRRMDVSAKRRLTQSEAMKRYIKTAYRGISRLEKSEDVRVRFEKKDKRLFLANRG